MKKLILVFFIFLSIASLAQKPANGTYLLKFFDLEYGKFHGTCKVIVKGDSATVYAVEDCHRKKGQLINAGLIKIESDGRWLIFHRKKKGENDSDYEEMPDRINFKKKIFYTY
jgi:hypothetical protein